MAALFLVFSTVFSTAPAFAQSTESSAAQAAAEAPKKVVFAWLSLRKDPRYTRKRTYARYLTGALGRPYQGAETAIAESRFTGSAIGVEFSLERFRAKNLDQWGETVAKAVDTGARYLILDAPAQMVAEAAALTRDRGVLLFNISSRDDALRQEGCRSHLLHIIPSHAMLMDAIAQYIVFKGWRKALMLTGPAPDDARIGAAFERAARRFGVEIVENRPFVFGNDPRNRDRNNIALLTAGIEHDVVFVADSDGEFARDVPYRTSQPRPVIGSGGLAAAAWHWAWERHGAPQLEKRFEKTAKRQMRSVDWAAWMAVKAVVEAMLRTQGADFPEVRDYLLGKEIILDGFKGNRVNFRPWNRQLRQPVLLVTHNWVVDRAPLSGFLHRTNNLDTLGFDERESLCEFDRP
ncbi:amino acid ABC transporter substrate-binding protein [Thioalkalivibrio sp. HK1]|uniref:amino acid ABC transporter substrate-binding protein n=1 Tax=Thioalkalivibrio sp. HK1 TaxID=1469245 RepID=UPI000683ED4B|nr:amino acid ABC transporter substrate-binding protein [Thioalkalivibrio sp. HK1]